MEARSPLKSVMGVFVAIPLALLSIVWLDRGTSAETVSGTVVEVREGAVARAAPGRRVVASVKLDNGTVISCEVPATAQSGFRVDVVQRKSAVFARRTHEC